MTLEMWRWPRKFSVKRIGPEEMDLPTYVYECKTCSDVFEVEQRITEDALTDCRCGAKGSLRRLIQPVGVVFNGPGFHINDYRNAPAPEAAKADAKPAEAGSPDAKPAESKPAETPAPESKQAAEAKSEKE